MNPLPRLLLATLLVSPLGAVPADQAALADEMATAAQTLLESLNDKKREAALIPFGDEERENFHYVPLERQGARYKDMTAVQRANTLRLLHTALSDDGSRSAVSIMALESVLAEIEGRPEHRDPELYWIAIFGTPGEMPWGWRFEGHHLSVNQTLTVHGISGTPLFMGANPGVVPEGHGRQSRQRVLGDAEDLGREFVLSLDADQKQQAIISHRAIGEIETGQTSLVEPLDHEGILFGDLNPDQQRGLVGLLQHYLDRHEDEISEAARQRIVDHGHQNLEFAWAGPTAVGEPHYYRIQGPTFVIEYANTQNDANHHHTVFRDFEDDFGRDLLRDHIRRDH